MISSDRICGECTACCKTHGVVELSKPAGVWCTHCDISKGCRIYKNRPQACANFRCLWLRGLGNEKQRPDHSKVVLGYSSPLKEGLSPILTIFELAPGAAERLFMKEVMIAMLIEDAPVLKRNFSGIQTLYMPRKFEKNFLAETINELREDGIEIQFVDIP